MKKRTVSLILVIVMVLSMSAAVFAMDDGTMPAASLYLDSYGVTLGAYGNGSMKICMTVDGVGVLDQIGVMQIDIEEKINGTWQYYGCIPASEHPEFYSYNSRGYLGTVDFTGTPGVSYRVTLMVYASKGTGSDTGFVTSYTVTGT